MRATLPVIAILAAGAALAAVYVRGSGPDNAPAATNASTGPSATARPAGLNTGKVAAFVYKSTPEPVPAFPFFDDKQETKTIGAFKGKVILLNLWATWCAPCRAEMPALDQLQKDMGSDKFEVVAVNVDKNGFDKAREFLKGIDVKSLALYADPTARAYRRRLAAALG